MTALRTAAQQALEALKMIDDAMPFPVAKLAMKNLRAALAEPEGGGNLPPPLQDPVWIQPDHLQKARQAPFLCRVEPTRRFADFVPLYTAPPQRKPLTEEEIMQCFADAGAIVKGQLWVKVARAIERAHGIT